MKRKQTLHPYTLIINQTQKIQSQKSRRQALQWLATQFPHAFDNSKRIRPLKMGIMKDVLAHAAEAAKVGISRSKLREAVVVFTRRLDYLTCLKQQELRVDLQGNITGLVAGDEAARAAMKIKKHIERDTQANLTLNSKPVLKSTPVNPQVIIKQKTTRAYDPSTLARLKEKLGIRVELTKQE